MEADPLKTVLALYGLWYAAGLTRRNVATYVGEDIAALGDSPGRRHRPWHEVTCLRRVGTMLSAKERAALEEFRRKFGNSSFLSDILDPPRVAPGLDDSPAVLAFCEG